MTTTSTLPPPLSAPPSVATLQGLLDGLQQPMRRGIPAPPTPEPLFAETRGTATRAIALGRGSVLDLTHMEQPVASRRAVVPLVTTTSPDDAPAPSGPAAQPPGLGRTPTAPALTWSAGRAHHPRRRAALAVVAAAAGTVAALVAAGELALP